MTSENAWFNVVMQDSHPDHKDKTLKVRVEVAEGTLCIMPEGYGEPDAAKGCGSTVWMELYEGRLRAIVSPDILDDRAIQIIDLEDAREDLVMDWGDPESPTAPESNDDG